MSDRVTDDSASTRRILELWPGASPPAGFADDVLDAAASAAGDGAGPAPGRRRTARVAAAIALASLAVASLVLLVVGLRGGGPSVSDAGARVTAERETLRIGNRAVAVAERGSALAWRTDGGAATVEQSRGSVFYRVDPGEQRFEVMTPGGRITVTGTCFRVDVAPAGGPHGATATAAVVTVAVYEGAVDAENPVGRARVAAGQRAVLRPDRAPVAESLHAAALDLVGATAPAPAGTTVEELRAREQAYRAQVSELRQRVAALESAVAASDEPAEPGQPPRGKFHDFSREELAWMAGKCELRYDIPGYAYELGSKLRAHEIARLRLKDGERELIDRINSQGDNRLLEQTKDLFVELTGERAVAETLAPRTLQHEIFLKSRPGDVERALQRLSAERAGLARPPADAAGQPPVERLLRLLIAAGDAYEARLAAALGTERAAELRRANAGMGSRLQTGCPDAESGPN